MTQFIPPETGIVYGLENEVYHAGSPVSNSQMGDLARSGFHFWNMHRNPARPPRKSKGGHLEGTLAHCALFEPAEFDHRYIVGPALNRNTNAWKSFVDANADRVAIQPDQYATAWAQAKSARGHPDLAALLASGDSEPSVYWIDEQTGVRCRCRPDFVSPVNDSTVILIDGKTYSDASPDEFQRQVVRKGYARQAAMYSAGYAAATGMTVAAFLFVAIESDYPFAASACVLDDAGMAAGYADFRRLIDLYAQCERTNTWPGWGEQIHQITVPEWAR